MTPATLQSFLLWSALINYGVLTISFLVLVFARDSVFRLHSRWFALERAHFEAILYLVLALYKIGIWLLFLVPYFALCVVGGSA